MTGDAFPATFATSQVKLPSVPVSTRREGGRGARRWAGRVGGKEELGGGRGRTPAGAASSFKYAIKRIRDDDVAIIFSL